MQEIKVELTKTPKEKPTDESKLGFGKIFTDHMFLMNYDEGQGWHDARIVPYGPIALEPAAMCLHYGQEVFEGMKAYKTKRAKRFCSVRRRTWQGSMFLMRGSAFLWSMRRSA